MITNANALNSMGKAQVASINDLANNAQTKANEAVGSAKSGLEALTSANPSESAKTMRGYGTQVADLAGQLPTYATNISDLAKTLASGASSLTDTGNNILGISNDLLNMNRESDNDYVKELLGLYDQFDPDKKVALAAQDVNNSYDTNDSSLLRDMSRAGVNVGSGRSNALKQQYAIARATAVAAAKTRARASGLTEQASAFNSLISSNANTLLNTAKDYLLAGSTVSSNAVSAYNTAAGVLSNSASLFGSAASIESSAANLELGYAKSVASQNNTVASALQYYSSLLDSQSARELNFLNQDLARATDVVKVDYSSNSSGDDWMNWNGTGHSQTWNANHGSSSSSNVSE